MKNKVEDHLKIIARYDEVLCEKAPKHAMAELRNDLVKMLDVF